MSPLSRRRFFETGVGVVASAAVTDGLMAATESKHVQLDRIEMLPVRASERTVWLFVRVHTNNGVTGLGEASDAFGYVNTTRAQALRMADELRAFFSIVQGRSPFEIARLRNVGLPRAAAAGLVASTALSAIEQALWDIAGKLVGRPIHALLGGKLRDHLPVYANINRATKVRTPAGFAATATRAVAEGFRALKLAPFDGAKHSDFPRPLESRWIRDGIASIAAVRDAVGPGVDLMVDAHSLFDVPLAIEVARQLEPHRLAWYEEPVAPEMIAETNAIRRAIGQPMAAGETLLRTNGFAPLCRSHAVEVIMPDVKHCGGVLELTHIAALAEVEGIAVAPHNPSGPVSTAVSVHPSATLSNFRTLELQWGEVPWRAEIVEPPELFVAGEIAVPDRPGCGVTLNDAAIRKYNLGDG